MLFVVPAQFRGPECRRVITQVIELRRLLEPWFEAQSSDQVAKLAIVLRVDGSLGSFGPPGVENVELLGRELSCDLVVADHGWAELGDQQIREILAERLSEAITICFGAYGIVYPKDELAALLGSLA